MSSLHTPAAAAAAPAAPRRVLPAIVFAQLLGISPWFAVNAVMPDLQAAHAHQGWPAAAVGTLSSSLQLGFIAGTLVFALLAVADRFPARRVFLACAFAAAACTLAAAAMASSYGALLAWRAITGFFLAGIYPVGMKIAAQWFPRGLGAALGWLVGALVVGSAGAHALRALASGGAGLPWQAVFVAVAALCVAAGLAMVWLVPEPARRPEAPAAGLRLSALASIWRDRRVRASAFGYFGHMWELYTVWVLLPAILATRLADSVAVSWWAFAALGAGALGCIAGGQLVARWGSARVAGFQLAASGLCCLAAPWLLQAPLWLFLAWLLLWGVTVAGDSPQFSALTAANAPRDAVGSVLTLTKSIGFAISALSIEVFVRAAAGASLAAVLPWLALGPLLGLLALRPLLGAGPAR
ncbi:MAG: MFS transporter [Burkholderiales bacterium]|nr:MFS transporter [Burkholderiales bacterium]